MRIEVTRIFVDENFVVPTLVAEVTIQHLSLLEALLHISGRMQTPDGKTVAVSNGSDFYTDNTCRLKLVPEKYFNTSVKEYSNQRTHITFPLNEKIIDHIENTREKQHDKSAKFIFEFTVKYLEISCSKERFFANENEPFISIKTSREHGTFEIKQSEWVRNFAPKLGIGNFLLLEMRIPIGKNVSSFWQELHTKLSDNLRGMETALRDGDWQKTMFIARKFYENIKIGDNKPGHEKFKKEFSKLLKDNQHSPDGIKNLYDGIWKFFEFISKYVHEKDKDGNFNPAPITTKEDAYFAYSLALGLLNLIGKKIQDTD